MKKLTRVERKRRRRRRFLRITLFIIFFFIAFKLAKKSDTFNVEKIVVQGNKKIKKEEILKKIDLNPGNNIFEFNILKSKRKLKEFNYIKKAKIKRKLPKEVIILIEERKEALQIKSDKDYIILDKEGIILDIIKSKNNKILTLNGISLEGKINNKSIGKNIKNHIKNEQLKEFLGEARKYSVDKKIKTIDIDKNKNVVLKTLDDKVIEFGKINNSSYKWNLLYEIFKYIDDEKIEYSKIIMNKGDNPIIVREDIIEEEGG